jgi:hypothetical protein
MSDTDTGSPELVADCPYWIKGYCVADRSCKLRHDPLRGGQLQESYLNQTRSSQPRIMHVPTPAFAYHPGMSGPMGAPMGAQIASAVYGGHMPSMAPLSYGYFGNALGAPIGAPIPVMQSSGPPRNYKTVQCRHYMRGHCMRGSACGFRHGEEEPSEDQSASYGHLPAELSNPIHPGRPFRTTTCKRWLQGNCTLGDRCTFRHDFQSIDNSVQQYSGIKRTLSPDRETAAATPSREDGETPPPLPENDPKNSPTDAKKLQKV